MLNTKMSCSFWDGDRVSLSDILAAREQRADWQRQLLTHYQKTVISFSLVLPGPIKQSSSARQLFTVGQRMFIKLSRIQSWPLIEQKCIQTKADLSALWVTCISALAVKKSLLRLEAQHPLGRLWDFDVIDPRSADQLSRQQLDEKVRSCLICSNPAKHCARTQQHPLSAILATMQNQLDAYIEHAYGLH